VRAPQPIPGIGRFALFEDLEGNVIGLLETA
jgi:predicted enzyme related to lactoylglutathione lyase